MAYMNELKGLLKPLRRKLMYEGFLNWSGLIGTAAAAVGLGVVLLSKFWYIMDLRVLFLLLIVITIVGAIALGFVIRRPSYEKVASEGDNLGYEERFVTALEILEQGEKRTKLEEMVVKDGIEKAKIGELAKRYKIKISTKMWKTMGLLVVASMITAFVGSPMQRETERYGDAQLKKIQEVKKEVLEEKNIDKAMLKEFKKESNRLTKNIKKSLNKSEAKSAVRKGQEKLKKLAKESIKPDLKKMGKKLSQSNLTKELGKAMEQGDSKAVAEAMAQMQEKLPALTKEERKEIQQMLEEAAAMTDEKSAGAMKGLAESLSTGNMKNASTATETLKESLMQQAKENEELRKSIESLNQQMASEQKQKELQKSDQNQNTTKEEGKGEGKGQGEGEGQGEGKGQGQGQGQGQGKGQGQGPGRGMGHMDTEKIYTRKMKEKEGDETKVSGINNETGESTKTHQTVTGNAGESVPYEDVYQDYRNEALKDLENDAVPYGMRELVSKYFSTLEK